MRLQRLLSLVFLAVGILGVVFFFLSPTFWDSEGTLTGSASLMISLCLISFGISAGLWLNSRAKSEIFLSIKTILWLFLAFSGQAAALQLIRAGKMMGYQHYRPLIRWIFDVQGLAYTIFAVQVILVLLGIFSQRQRIITWLKQAFKPWQLILMGFVYLLPSATVSADPRAFVSELAFAAFVQLIQLGNLLLILVNVPEGFLIKFKKRLGSLWESPPGLGGLSARLDLFVVLAALWVTACSAFLNQVIYQHHPHIPDEVVYLYQARMLADGKLSMPAPPVPEAFSVYLMEYDGPRWYPAPPVGWPAALALGTLAGVPWLVNPLLGGANLILAYLILVELYDRRTARLAVFLLAFSPWFIFMAMNYMTHTFTLTCALMAVLGIIHARRTGRLRWALAAGLALGVCSLIRPLEGLIMAGLLGLWSLGIGGSRLSWSSLTGLVFSTGVIAAIVFPYNQLLTGSWKVFPINKYTDEVFGVNSNAYGFGPDRGMGWPIDPFPGHSPLDATINSDLNTFQLNVELFGWSTGSLWPVLLWLFIFRFKKADFLMVAVIAAIFVAFFFYYFSGGPDFGARYWYLMIIPLVALSARGLEEITARWSFNPAVESLAGARVWLAVISLCLMALVNFLPWRALDKYFHYLGMRPDLQRIAQETPFGRSLVLVQGSENPDYASAAVYNPLDFTSPVPIYAWDKTPNIRTALLRSFADRPVWIVEGPTLTGKGFQTTAGPMTANQLLMQMGEQP